MSATPIPRTLALILYGDLDVSILDELPPGREPVDTFLVGESYRPRINAFIRKQVAEGHQCFVVCPAVEENEELGIKAASVWADTLQQTVFPDLCICTVYEFFCSSNIGLRRVAVGIVFHDPLLGFIVDLTDEVGLLCIRAHNNGLAVQHIETQLTEAAPNVDLVRIMVAGGVLTGLKARHMVKSVGRTAIGLTVQTMAATIGFLAVEPNKPSAALFGDAGDFAGGIGRGRTCCECCNTVIGIKLCRGCIIRQLYMNRFL